MSAVSTRPRLELVGKSADDLSVYLHHHGYVIEREKRGWSERGIPRGTRPCPLYSWVISDHIARRRSMLDTHKPAFRAMASSRPQNRSHHTFNSLAEARQWCDENPREGWNA